MRPDDMTRDHLIHELTALRRRIGELEAVEIERRRAEEAAAKSRTYAQSLIDSSLDMIIAVDPDRRIIEFNRAAQETFGYSRTEVLGQHVDMLYADPSDGRSAHETARRTGRFTAEVRNKKKNGKIFPAFLAASVLRDPSGEFIGVMGISRDITERKRAERELERQARTDRERLSILEEVSRAKSALLATISLEMGAPLNAIVGFAELIKDGRFGPLNDIQRRYLGHIVTAARHMVNLINDILKRGEGEAGRPGFQAEALFPPEAEQTALDMFRPEAKAVDPRLQLRLPLPGRARDR